VRKEDKNYFLSTVSREPARNESLVTSGTHHRAYHYPHLSGVRVAGGWTRGPASVEILPHHN
jgi:hypothetical protein